jgi:hypothetical protein
LSVVSPLAGEGFGESDRAAVGERDVGVGEGGGRRGAVARLLGMIVSNPQVWRLEVTATERRSRAASTRR